MDLFDLFAKISLDDKEFQGGMENAIKTSKNVAASLKSGFSAIGKAAAAGLTAVTAAAGAGIAALNSIAESTEEYRTAMGKLNTAFEAAGFSNETAKSSYEEFYKILGDTDTATEASQLLAKLADSEEDVAWWTQIAAGVNGTFGDSLPIESLIESANETAKVGQVTGTLADALNWAGISEDFFNERLENCSTESERNKLIMDALSRTYSGAAEAFYKNNEAVISARENQAKLDEVMSKLGETVQKVKNGLMSEFLPAISSVADAFIGMINGVERSDETLSQAIRNLVENVVKKLPSFLDFGLNILTVITESVVENLPVLINAAIEILGKLGAAIVEMLPMLLDAGIEIILTLADGIAEALPELIPAIFDVILQIFEVLTSPETASQLIDAALKIIVALAQGLMEALPEILTRVPQIILNIAEALIANLPTILEAAAEIGLAIVQGVWEGITGAGAWLAEQIGDFFGGIVDGIKELLGIHSPSRVFAGIGENMALGLGTGWENEFSRIKGQIETGFDFGPTKVNGIGFDIAQTRNVGIGGHLMGANRDNEAKEIVINLTANLDGKAISRASYRYNMSESERNGTSLVMG